ncbi:hypothetical protein CPLU01_09524 [Colletotrichum plurivorum]|uniref:Uncharacterized protein n=1 Tax=Colletotrichum plurivorum TaxID=2175906 RepID=A0A8H6NAY3_9PEZI|nr:hypothetical protein CPLU01_09524 [Colletotrichum plurivorum]
MVLPSPLIADSASNPAAHPATAQQIPLHSLQTPAGPLVHNTSARQPSIINLGSRQIHQHDRRAHAMPVGPFGLEPKDPRFPLFHLPRAGAA